MTFNKVTFKKQKKNHVVFGSENGLSEAHLSALYGLLESKALSGIEYEARVAKHLEQAKPSEFTGTKDRYVLTGRGQVSVGEVPGLGPVIVKHYARGGLLRALVENYYIKWGATRGEQEYQTLTSAASLGVNVPEAIAYAYSGGAFYRAWLIMKEIPCRRSLAELGFEDEDLCTECLTQLIEQLSILIHNRILHIDLHPGNVVVDKDNKVLLLDFDKAQAFRGGHNQLRDSYLRRWRRAVIKHSLPDYVSEMVCNGLRQNFEELM